MSLSPDTEAFAGWPRPRQVSLMVPTGPEESRDSFGEPAQEWAQVAQVWASVKPLSGRELWNAQQVQADVTHAVRMRWRQGVDPKMELDLNGRRLRILSVLNLEERNRTLELLCQEQVG